MEYFGMATTTAELILDRAFRDSVWEMMDAQATPYGWSLYDEFNKTSRDTSLYKQFELGYRHHRNEFPIQASAAS